MELKLFLFVTIISTVYGRIYLDVDNKYNALDESLYKEVLNEEQCHEQINFIRRNAGLLIQFADAGIRTPRGVAQGNFIDMGNYIQCLGITHETEEMTIQGKYCTILVPLSQNWSLPWNSDMPGFDPTFLKVDKEVKDKMEEANWRRKQLLVSMGLMNEDILKSIPSVPDLGFTFRLAVCIPKPCSTQQALTSLLFNVSAIGFQYEDDFCRLPNDKPWSPADTTATVIFSIIGLLTVFCTAYDLIYSKILKKDPRQSNPLYTSFSVYTNGRRLMNFSSAPGTLHCLDGIRIWAMMWVVLGHAFVTEVFVLNTFEVFLDWVPSLQSLWVISAPITVDTFFTISGMLLVYTTAGKINGVQLLKNLPIFYLNRLFRLFPLLATVVLLQASFFNRISDGPYWESVETQTNYCRNHWFWTLLYVQNYIGQGTMCMPHSWYLAIDVHLYLISPLVLFWVLGGKKKVAWAALVGGVLAALLAGSVYSFINNFPSGTVASNRPDISEYFYHYYFNTLTRASPFFVGMLFGYFLHNCRNVRVQLSWITVASLWTIAATVSTTIFFYSYFIVQPYWDYQTVDNIMNSFMRPAWSAALCWLVFACTHGYGGPVNWFLTLNIWKLPSRISYAIYIFHYPLQFVINSSALSPVYFTVPRFTFKAVAHIAISLVVGYFLTLLIDAPFSTLVKMLLDKNKKKSVGPAKEDNAPQIVRSEKKDNIVLTNDVKVDSENDKSSVLKSENVNSETNNVKENLNNSNNIHNGDMNGDAEDIK